jgi:hypothetical protein
MTRRRVALPARPGLLCTIGCLSLLAVAAPARAQRATPAPAPCEVPAYATQREPRAMAEGWVTAFNNLEWDAFRCAFDDSATVFAPFDDTPERLDGRERFEARFAAYFARMRSDRSGPPYLQMRPAGWSVAPLGDGVVVVSFTFPAGTQVARRTLVLRWTDGAWRIVHLHGSMAPGGS